MEKSCLYSIRVCLIFYILMLTLIWAISASESTTEESDTICIPRELYVTLTDLLRKEVTEQKEETQAERLVVLENKLAIYEKDRSHIFRYFDSITEITKRMMQLEKENDLLKASLQEVKDNIHDVTNKVQASEENISALHNDLMNIKYNIREIQRDIPEMKLDTQNVQQNVQCVNNSIQRIDETSRGYQENFTVEINHVKFYVADVVKSIIQQQERDNTSIAKMFTDINRSMENLIQNYSISMERIKHDIQQAFEDEEQFDAEIEKNCSVAIATYDKNFNKKLAKLTEEMAAVNQNSYDTNQIVTTLQNDMVSLTSKVHNIRIPTSPESELNRPAAHLMGSVNRLDQISFPGRQFPVSSWIYDEDLAFTNQVKYRHGRIVVSSDGLYYVYSQVSFLDVFGNGSMSNPTTSANGLSHYIYRYNIIYPNGGEEKLIQNKQFGEHTSYLGALFHLRQGDELFIKVSNLSLIVRESKLNYFGLFKLSS